MPKTNVNGSPAQKIHGKKSHGSLHRIPKTNGRLHRMSRTNVNGLTLQELRAQVSSIKSLLEENYTGGWKSIGVYTAKSPNLRKWLLYHFPSDFVNGPMPQGYGAPRKTGVALFI